tara:strand:- start:12221 stop:12427 length:207 start_codon:yes stop_codon:yes gene_type:complete
MKVLNFSGGAFKASGHVGASEVLIKNGYKPDIITGVSLGAVLAVPIALRNLYLEGKNIAFTYKSHILK